MRAIILAGGKGTRLAPYTFSFPKPLVPLGDKPILDIIIRQLSQQEVKSVTMAIGHLGELIMAYFGNGDKFGVRIDYSKEDEPLGTAGPLSLIKDLERDFFVINGDILTTLSFQRLMEYHKNHNAIATIAMHTKTVKLQLGVIHTNSNHEVTNYVEKPSFNYQVSMGIYVFSHSVAKYIRRKTYLDFPDLILKLLSNNEKVMSFPCHDYWLDIGTHSEYEKAVKEYDQNKKRYV